MKDVISFQFLFLKDLRKNREDLWELLAKCNMNVNNSLEWLIRTDTRYFGDRLYVNRFEEKNIIAVDSMY